MGVGVEKDTWYKMLNKPSHNVGVKGPVWTALREGIQFVSQMTKGGMMCGAGAEEL